MIKKIMLGLLLSIGFCTPLHAEAKEIVILAPCENFMTIFEMHRKSGERLMFVGDGAIKDGSSGNFFKGALSVWWNIDTQKASVTIQFPDGTMCLLAPSQNFQPWTEGQPWDQPEENKQSF